MDKEINIPMTSPEITEFQAKKRKVETNADGDKTLTLDGFKVDTVINVNARQKYLFLHCKKNEENAVVLLEKTPFDSSAAPRILSDETKIKPTLQNDIYSTYTACLPDNLNDIKATVIYPATEKHIAKYSDQETFVIQETSELFTNVTLPYLQKQSFSIQWVYNILEKKCEAECIVFEDANEESGFILIPDMKWDRKDLNSLYLQAIVHKHDIKSIRDLNKSHLPLLKNILEKGTEAIYKQYGIPMSKLRIYLHYQPSYYHLHVHFNHIKLDTPGFEADRAHLLATVIRNIEMKEDYYQQTTLVYKVREQDGLYQMYKEAKYFVEL